MARSTYSLRKAVVDIALPQSTVITAYAETGIKITITRLSQKQATTKASFSPKVDFGALELPSSACLQYWMAAQCDKFFQTMSTFSPPLLNLNSKKSVAEPLGQTRAQLATLRLLLLMEMMLTTSLWVLVYEPADEEYHLPVFAVYFKSWQSMIAGWSSDHLNRAYIFLSLFSAERGCFSSFSAR